MIAVAIVVAVAGVARRRAFFPPLPQQVAHLAAAVGNRFRPQLVQIDWGLGLLERERVSGRPGGNKDGAHEHQSLAPIGLAYVDSVIGTY